jgi:CxxC-x17-CxxC domain-containing protein
MKHPQHKKYDASCKDCGVDTTVHFEPTDLRPAFCKSCYQKRRGDKPAPQKKTDTNTAGRCLACGSQCAIPQAAIDGKSVFCGICITSEQKLSGQLKGELGLLHKKLDHILALLDATAMMHLTAKTDSVPEVKVIKKSASAKTPTKTAVKEISTKKPAVKKAAPEKKPVAKTSAVKKKAATKPVAKKTSAKKKAPAKKK